MAISKEKPEVVSPRATQTPALRLRLLLLAGVVMIGGALYVRSSAPAHEVFLRSKDLPDLEAYARNHPDDSAAQYFLGKRYFQSRRYAEAAAAYDTAVRLDPKSVRARLELGYSLFEQGKLPQAGAEFRQVKSLDDRQAPAEYMLGKIAWATGNLKEAPPHLQRATELNPRLDEAWYGLGLCLIQLKRYPEALNDIQKAMALNPNRAQYPATLGDLQLKLFDRTEEARRLFERALLLDPNYGQGCALMGAFLVHHYSRDEQGALARAEALLLKATKLPTFHPQEVYLDLGQVYLQQAQYGKAVPALQESIRLAPNDERAYFELIKAYHYLGNTKGAEAAQARFRYISESRGQKYSLESHLSLAPRDADARLKLAHIYLDFNLVAQAAQQYRFYLALRPEKHDLALEERLREQTALDAARLRYSGFPSLQ